MKKPPIAFPFTTTATAALTVANHAVAIKAVIGKAAYAKNVNSFVANRINNAKEAINLTAIAKAITAATETNISAVITTVITVLTICASTAANAADITVVNMAVTTVELKKTRFITTDVIASVAATKKFAVIIKVTKKITVDTATEVSVTVTANATVKAITSINPAFTPAFTVFATDTVEIFATTAAIPAIATGVISSTARTATVFYVIAVSIEEITVAVSIVLSETWSNIIIIRN